MTNIKHEQFADDVNSYWNLRRKTDSSTDSLLGGL